MNSTAVAHRHVDCKHLRVMIREGRTQRRGRIILRPLRVNAALRADPTRTTTLRRAFIREINKRFAKLKRDIRLSILDNDCFGIQPDVLPTFAATRRKAFAFVRSPRKVDLFMKWLEEQEAAGLLEIVRRPGVHGTLERPWSDVFIDSAYAKGMRRARAELRAKGYDVPRFEQMPGGISAMMSQPYHADRIGAIYSRTYEDLKTVAQEMNAQVRRKIADGITTGLARGLAEGKNPMTIARELVKDVANRVDKIGITRARMIARTEVIRAHHVATIAEYEQAEEEMQVEVMAEWLTAGFEVCPLCVDLQVSGPYKLKQVEGMIPAHPNCRCCVIPLVKEKPRRPPAGLPGTAPTRPARPRGLPIRRRPKKRKPPSPDEPFRPVKTREEGEEWLRKRGLADRLLFDNDTGESFWGRTAPKAEATRRMNEMLAELDRVQRKFGRRLPKVEEVYVTKGIHGSSATKEAMGLAQVGVSGFRPSRVGFGRGYSQKLFNDCVEHWKKTGRRTTVGINEANRHQVAPTVRHEWAHHIDYVYHTTRGRSYEKWKQLMRDLAREDGFEARMVSYYAQKNDAELWCEAFAYFTSPVYDTPAMPRLPARLEAYIRDVLDKLPRSVP